MSLSRVFARSLVWIPLLDLGLVLLLAGRLGAVRSLAWLLGSVLFGVFLVLGGGLPAPRGPGGEASLPDRAWAQARLARLAAGILWIWPGPLTDLLGAVLLVPALRRSLLGWLWRHLAPGGFVSSFGFEPYESESQPEAAPPSTEPPPEGPVRDVDFEVLERDRRPGGED